MFQKQHEKPIAVVGFGGCGCNAVQFSADRPLDNTDYYFCETKTLPRKSHNVKQFMIKEGDMEFQVCKIADNVLRTKPLIVIIISGMGGQTVSRFAPAFAEEMKRRGVCVISALTRPFLYEGTIAYDLVKECIPNPMLCCCSIPTS